MSSYKPPLDEIYFALRTWAKHPALLNPPAIPDFPDAETISAVLNGAGRFAVEVLAPLDVIGHREGCELRPDGSVRTPNGWKEAYAQFVAADWNTVNFPSQVGGQGLPSPVAIAVAEIFEGANLAFSLALMPFAGVVALLDRFGTNDQKSRYLAPLVSGRWSATLAMTESHAGSDIGALRMSASPLTEGFGLRGQKVFISYGAHDLNENILHFVLARDPAGRAGAKGLSLYLVPKRLVNPDGSLGELNDVQCIAVERKMGIHGSPTTTLLFGAKDSAWGERLGDPCKGLDHMFVVLNHARLNIGVFGLASAERAWQIANAYANERVQGLDAAGHPCVIARHPDVRRMLLEMQTGVDAMRAVCYYAAGLLERSQRDDAPEKQDQWRRRLDLLTPVVKGWVTEFAYETAGTGVQVAGGAGYMDESPASRCLLEARVHTIYEGTTGVQALDLTLRKVAKDGGKAAANLLDEMGSTWPIAARAARLDGNLADIKDALAMLAAATDWIVGQAASRPAAVQAVGVHYLMMWGYALGAWLMTTAAQEQPARVDRANFFLRHRLPRVQMHWRVIEHGAGAVAPEVVQNNS